MSFEHLIPVPFQHVQITDGLWKRTIDLVRRVTVMDCLKKSQHSIDNFRRAAGQLDGDFEGIFFDDADVYKILEGIAYVLTGHTDDRLEKIADDLIDVVCAAQQEDGYLFNFFTLGDLDKRWTDMDHHEAFCVSQLVEAGIAYCQATGKTRLLDAALRAVDQMMTTLQADPQGWINGHEGIEMALTRLYRFSHDEKYLRYAEWFVEQRGHVKLRLPISYEKLFFTDEYCQNDKPARELSKVTGHAVRAMYYYSGLADIASIREDEALDAALIRLWNNVVPANLYITGGIGQSAYNEGFTKDWSLPNLTAYCETCASVGMAFWNRRMTCGQADSRYADLVERELYNGILSGLSLSGDHYFYENPLASVGTHHRREWFHVPCCPTNLVRFLPAVGGMVFAASGRDVYVDQYIPSAASIPLETGELKLRMETAYPWNGRVTLSVEDCPVSTRLMLRRPGWCKRWTLRIDGQEAAPSDIRGYLPVEIAPGMQVVLDMDMPVERIHADDRVKENENRVAIMRGPVVYCAEEVDNPGIPTEYFHADFSLDSHVSLAAVWKPDLLGGVMTLEGANVLLIPYYAWDNRQSGGMAVWMKEG